MCSLLNKIFGILYHSMVLLWMKEIHDVIFPTCAYSYSIIADVCPSVTQLFFNDRCFWKLDTEMNFWEAHRYCQKHGGILTDVPDEETDKMLSRYFGHGYWIGIRYKYTEKQFVDMMHRSIEYKNWAFGQPNNSTYMYNTDHACVRKRENGWYDDSCNLRYKAICSKEIVLNCTDEMKETLSSDIYLWISVEATSFFEADIICQTHKRTFTEMTDNMTLHLLYETIKNRTEVWIGAPDLVLEGYFMNIRNETQCFGLEDWKTLTDNSNASDCVAFSGKTSQFVILPCNTQLPVLCSSSFEATTLASVSRLTTDPVPSTSVSASILTTSSTASSSTSVSTSTPTTSSTTGSSTSVSTSSPTTSSTTGSSTSVSTSTPSTSPTTGSSTSVSTPTTSSTTGSSTSVSTSTPSTSPTTGSSTSVSTSTPTTSTGSSTSVSSSTQTKSSKAVSSTLAPKSSTTDSVPSTTTSPLKTVSSTLAASSLSTSTPKSSSTVKSSTDTFQSVYVSSSLSTTQTTYLMKSTTASSVNQGCMCPCERMKNQVFITDKKVLKAKIEKMKKELKVNKADLNKKLRKRLSVFDKRASAIAFGTIFGPLLIAFFIGIIVFSDIPIMMRHLKYGLCRRLGKKKRKRRIGSDDVRGCVTDVQKDKDEIQEDEIIDNPA